MGVTARVVVLFAWLVVIPAAAFAQASITGVVRDASGAVIPGVTVEAASPDLIEKVRVVVTDNSGQYRIITLPPGTYSVTFSLAGFSTVRREGVALTGTFTATINADLRVGSLEETVTVTGETPLVDIQGTTQQRVVGAEVVDAVPSGRMPSSFVVLIPGMVDADTLQYQAVVTDPQVLTASWTTPTRTLRRQPFKKIGEGMCFDTTTYDLAQGAKN